MTVKIFMFLYRIRQNTVMYITLCNFHNNYVYLIYDILLRIILHIVPTEIPTAVIYVSTAKS